MFCIRSRCRFAPCSQDSSEKAWASLRRSGFYLYARIPARPDYQAIRTQSQRGYMAQISVGSDIGIPCKFTPGPFDEEVIVEFDTLDGMVSGFTRTTNVKETGGQQLIRGRVLEVNQNVITAMVEGSFFTTNGLANFQPDRVLAEAA